MKRKKYNDLSKKTKMQLLNGEIIKLRNIHFIKTDEYVKAHRTQKIINEQNFQGYFVYGGRRKAILTWAAHENPCELLLFVKVWLFTENINILVWTPDVI